MRTPVRWALLHRTSAACIDGAREWFQWDGLKPVLFRTRQEARQFAKEKYGRDAKRPDLKAYPHGWLMPVPVKVRVVLERVRAAK